MSAGGGTQKAGGKVPKAAAAAPSALGPGGAAGKDAGGRMVALLRGINVGTAHRVAMADLAAGFAALGASEVKTLILSGNVVFTSPAAGLGEEQIATALEARFGFAIPVLLRTAGAFRAALAANPLQTLDPKWLHVVFLRAPVSAAGMARLAALSNGYERVIAGDRILYLALPDGVSKSKLANQLLKPQEGIAGTMRTWTTAQKLASLL